MKCIYKGFLWLVFVVASITYIAILASRIASEANKDNLTSEQSILLEEIWMQDGEACFDIDATNVYHNMGLNCHKQTLIDNARSKSIAQSIYGYNFGIAGCHQTAQGSNIVNIKYECTRDKFITSIYQPSDTICKFKASMKTEFKFENGFSVCNPMLDKRYLFTLKQLPGATHNKGEDASRIDPFKPPTDGQYCLDVSTLKVYVNMGKNR